MKRFHPAFLLFILALFSSWAAAEEGMWTFDNPPVEDIEKRYHFTLTEEWLNQVRLASVRFNDGGSGAFVSPRGLVLTNHHVALGQLQKLSTLEKNYARDGFYAPTRPEELKCPDLELNVLVSTQDVTSEVRGVVEAVDDPQQALEARRTLIARIEKESLEKTGYRSNVISLYQGGEYWLYRYKKYTDVRLVFAPEQKAAFFGGDPDNFTYPRYCLDFAFFRVYENEQPVESDQYLKVNPGGAEEGELVFVSGNPGSTDRLYTMERLITLRDYVYPLYLDYIHRRLELLRNYAARGPEQERQASGQIFGYENALKAFTGELNGLQDPEVMAIKRQEEEEFRRKIAQDPELQQAGYLKAWEEIARAEENFRERLEEWFFRRFPSGTLASTALTLVQYAEEVEKPDGQRLEGFHDSQLESLRFRLLSPAPVHLELEETLLADALELSLDKLGRDDPFLQPALAGGSASEVAHRVMSETKLADPAVRRTLVEGGKGAVESSTDPLIALARSVDPVVREMQKGYEDHVRSIRERAGEQLGKARFAVYGKSTYPDATFTLRLSYGAVKGYPMNGTQAPAKTTFYGLYNRAHGFDLKPPYDLPPRFLNRREKLDLSTPLNFVSTVDITGGNSGSPVINRNRELVGVIFDGNIESLVGSFVYKEETNRAISVHSAAVIEALQKLYDAPELVEELLN